jgi:hypothetical protein
MPKKSKINKSIVVSKKYKFDLEIYPRLISWEIFPKDNSAALYAFSNKERLNKLIEKKYIYEKRKV